MTTKTSACVILVLLASGRLTAQAADNSATPAQGGRVDSSAATSSADNGPKDRLASYTDAVNRRNVAAVVDFFTNDAVLIDVDGNATRGSSLIGEQFSRGFAEPTKYTLESAAESIRFLTPDVAQVEGTSKHTAPNESSIVNRFSALFVRKDNVWRIAEIRDLPAATEDVAPYERLKELEWMVGDWVDESANATVNSSIRWGENKAYLVRNTDAQVGKEKASSSLIILAWDPRTAQIRSWLFSSEGGLGEAVWTRSSDNQWVIKATGVLRDGSPTSATQIIDVVGKDAVKTKSLDRVIGGQIAPDIDEVLMVRKPPEPSTSR
jgi:uncharacterized protein (TIGR02246 family)